MRLLSLVFNSNWEIIKINILLNVILKQIIENMILFLFPFLGMAKINWNNWKTYDFRKRLYFKYALKDEIIV